jgi:hypothetical protein
MPRLCTICIHPAHAAIDEGLLVGLSIRRVSGQYGLSKSAVDRHKESHLSDTLTQDKADLESEFQAACEDARERYQSGRFVLERLGAERVLDPQLMATLWQLRQGLLEEYGTASPAMTMVIDLSVMSYYNALRIQGWIGELSLVIEHELFAEDSLKVKLRQQYGSQIERFAVEEHLQRLKEQLVPVFERVNRQVLSNLQALQRPKHIALPMVAIGRANQVNVAQQQVNMPSRGPCSSPPVDPR